ncbi:hypothetical protein BE17_38130 [Sorangium cellulosum]|uniref:Uncharacterized protein n=1 Tax=Sorangium cellulosum TaxID=56 RepID=A0A150RI91_SORCE|nr:hypothetical protein BE17_38130 [Sorangium cellulosum]
MFNFEHYPRGRRRARLEPRDTRPRHIRSAALWGDVWSRRTWRTVVGIADPRSARQDGPHADHTL